MEIGDIVCVEFQIEKIIKDRDGEFVYLGRKWDDAHNVNLPGTEKGDLAKRMAISK